MRQPMEVTRAILSIEATPGVPIACNMSDARDTPRERLAEYGRLFAHAMIGRQRTATGVEFTLAAKAGVVGWVSDLVRREAACCPFFSYRLEEKGGCIVWCTSSDAGAAAQAMLEELYELPEFCADGIDGYFKRLEGRGVSVTSPGEGQYRIHAASSDAEPGAPGLLGKAKARCGC
jgi:hypothetical protein